MKQSKPLNHYHRRLCEELSKRGVCYVEEYPVGPYSVDIYLPEFPRLVEVDGSHHVSRKRDEARDEWILQHVDGADVVRIKVGTPVAEAVERMLEWREA